MKKNDLRGLIVLGICLIVYNLLVFLLPLPLTVYFGSAMASR